MSTVELHSGYTYCSHLQIHIDIKIVEHINLQILELICFNPILNFESNRIYISIKLFFQAADPCVLDDAFQEKKFKHPRLSATSIRELCVRELCLSFLLARMAFNKGPYHGTFRVDLLTYGHIKDLVAESGNLMMVVRKPECLNPYDVPNRPKPLRSNWLSPSLAKRVVPVQERPMREKISGPEEPSVDSPTSNRQILTSFEHSKETSAVKNLLGKDSELDVCTRLGKCLDAYIEKNRKVWNFSNSGVTTRKSSDSQSQSNVLFRGVKFESLECRSAGKETFSPPGRRKKIIPLSETSGEWSHLDTKAKIKCPFEKSMKEMDLSLNLVSRKAKSALK